MCAQLTRLTIGSNLTYTTDLMILGRSRVCKLALESAVKTLLPRVTGSLAQQLCNGSYLRRHSAISLPSTGRRLDKQRGIDLDDANCAQGRAIGSFILRALLP
ncbi:uncharacterized protein VTP21DRAFT_1665 [Calcarisporiella thermophila]|uniref:uncharacterized protein n=1 Tax=Calcarisporiella thermophila TaxID=911321 RepID=UPI00374449C8